ncbi:UvrD-helicase domain-containing protein [Roseateles sp.]|uniref:UvrD-helicase domain-containing protein n=1 Tax=Roseateles sp. TaxID=1971397 RepID=UPI0039E7EF50
MSDPVYVPANIIPSDEQLAIQLVRTKLLLVEANAGAAKTTTLALRIAQALQRGAAPETVLAITATEPAVIALKERLNHIGVSAAVTRRLRIQTFETFSLSVLAKAEGVAARVVASAEQVASYVVRAIERAQSLPEERFPDELMAEAAPADLVEGLLKSFDLIKGRMLAEQLDPDERMTPERADELGFGYLTMRAWSCYEFFRRGGHPDRPEFRFLADGTYDLARMLLAGEITKDDAWLRQGLTLVCLDEMHDVNEAAFTVLKGVLAANPRAAFVGVGDRDQVIHTQTGAEAAFMGARFAAEIGTPQVLPLTFSRRFSPQLARYAGALAGKPYAADPAMETVIATEHCADWRLGGELIARKAKAHLEQQAMPTMRVMLRYPAQSVKIEHELMKLSVPYAATGFQPYLDRAETLLVRGLYAHATDNYGGFEDQARRAQLLNAWLQFSGARVDSIELRNLDSAQAQRLAVSEAAESLDTMKTFIEGHVLRTANPAALHQLEGALTILRGRDLDAFEASFLKALDPLRLASRVFVRKDEAAQVTANIQQLCRLILDEGTDLDGGFRMLATMDFARRLLRQSDRVVLSSIEASKGLEFDHVIVPHLSKGEFGDGSTENRNLLYVALTRAKRQLTLMFDRERPSRFLKDAQLV